MYSLSFITERDFKQNVLNTLNSYNQSLHAIDLARFNSNLIDPIKLLFDKSVYRKSLEEIIQLELHRQRDKSNTNAIGYFHQNMFQYIEHCTVPRQGWDVIFTGSEYHIYVEMKNKHNTMNSSSSQKTYIQMQNQILKTPKDYCYLVEVIAPESRNIPWGCSVNRTHCEHEHIRRVSIDQFYAIVTGVEDAFFQICMQLPQTLDELIAEQQVMLPQKDTVLDELRTQNPDMLKSLYLLAFQSYEGFQQL